MNLIASIDNNWHLGCGGELLFRVPADLKYFRAHTLGKVVVLGRKTLQTFPGAKPLSGRENIILTRNPDFTCAGARVAHNLDELFVALRDYADEDIWVAGGAEIYCLLLPYCRYAYITRFAASLPADCALPDLDAAENWRLAERSEEQQHEGLHYCYLIYENTAPRPYPRQTDNNDV